MGSRPLLFASRPGYRKEKAEDDVVTGVERFPKTSRSSLLVLSDRGHGRPRRNTEGRWGVGASEAHTWSLELLDLGW